MASLSADELAAVTGRWIVSHPVDTWGNTCEDGECVILPEGYMQFNTPFIMNDGSPMNHGSARLTRAENGAIKATGHYTDLDTYLRLEEGVLVVTHVGHANSKKYAGKTFSGTAHRAPKVLGQRCLSSFRPVKSSSEQRTAANLTDGTESEWMTGEDPAWLEVDLGQECVVQKVELLWWAVSFPDHYSLLSSTDGIAWKRQLSREHQAEGPLNHQRDYNKWSRLGGWEDSTRYVRLELLNGFADPWGLKKKIGMRRIEIHGLAVSPDQVRTILNDVWADEKRRPRLQRMVLVGDGRAGKSSTVRGMRGQAFDEAQVSTHGAAREQMWIEKTVVRDWENADFSREFYSTMVAEKIEGEQSGHDQLVSANQLELIRRRATNQRAQLGATAAEGQKDAAHVTAPGERNEASALTRVNMDPISVGATGKVAGYNTDNESPFLQVWDMAGQHEYYHMHRILITTGIYLLIFDAALWLDTEGIPGTQQSQSRHSLIANAVDVWEFWLSSLRVFAPKSRAILVATHADVVASRSGEAVYDRIGAALAPIVAQYEDMLHVPGSAKSFFVVDNRHGPHTELRAAVDLASRSAMATSELIPVRWASFVEQMGSIFTEQVLPRVDFECRLIAEGVCQSPFEVLELLNYFHTVGLILFFDKDLLRQYVVIDVNYVVQAMADVMSVADRHASVDALSSLRSLLLSFGILSVPLLDEVWGRGQDDDQRAFLLAILEEYGLLLRSERDPLPQIALDVERTFGYRIYDQIGMLSEPIVQSFRIYSSVFEAFQQEEGQGLRQLLQVPDEVRIDGTLRALRRDEPPPPVEMQPVSELSTLLEDAEVAQLQIKQRIAPGSAWAEGRQKMGTIDTLTICDLAFDPWIKGVPRIQQKTASKYGGNFSRVRDIARLALCCDTCVGLIECLEDLKETFDVIEIENRFRATTGLGWRDVTLLVEEQLPNGRAHICEIQVQLTAYNEARKGAHKYYTDIRTRLPEMLGISDPTVQTEVQTFILDELVKSPAQGGVTWIVPALLPMSQDVEWDMEEEALVRFLPLQGTLPVLFPRLVASIVQDATEAEAQKAVIYRDAAILRVDGTSVRLSIRDHALCIAVESVRSLWAVALYFHRVMRAEIRHASWSVAKTFLEAHPEHAAVLDHCFTIDSVPCAATSIAPAPSDKWEPLMSSMRSLLPPLPGSGLAATDESQQVVLAALLFDEWRSGSADLRFRRLSADGALSCVLQVLSPEAHGVTTVLKLLARSHQTATRLKEVPTGGFRLPTSEHTFTFGSILGVRADFGRSAGDVLTFEQFYTSREASEVLSLVEQMCDVSAQAKMDGPEFGLFAHHGVEAYIRSPSSFEALRRKVAAVFGIAVDDALLVLGDDAQVPNPLKSLQDVAKLPALRTFRGHFAWGSVHDLLMESSVFVAAGRLSLFDSRTLRHGHVLSDLASIAVTLLFALTPLPTSEVLSAVMAVVQLLAQGQVEMAKPAAAAELGKLCSCLQHIQQSALHLGSLIEWQAALLGRLEPAMTSFALSHLQQQLCVACMGWLCSAVDKALPKCDEHPKALSRSSSGKQALGRILPTKQLSRKSSARKPSQRISFNASTPSGPSAAPTQMREAVAGVAVAAPQVIAGVAVNYLVTNPGDGLAPLANEGDVLPVVPQPKGCCAIL